MSLENGKQVVDSGEARLIALGEFSALICTDVYACTTVLLALLKPDNQDSSFLFLVVHASHVHAGYKQELKRDFNLFTNGASCQICAYEKQLDSWVLAELNSAWMITTHILQHQLRDYVLIS